MKRLTKKIKVHKAKGRGDYFVGRVEFRSIELKKKIGKRVNVTVTF